MKRRSDRNEGVLRVSVLVSSAAAAIATWTAATPASACSYYPRFPGFAEPFFEASEVVIEGARLELSCDDQGGYAACTLDARYRIRNTEMTDVASFGAIFSRYFIPSVTLGGPSGEVRALVENATWKSVEPLLRPDTMLRDFTSRVSMFRFSIPAREARELKVGATFTIPPSENPCQVEGVFSRHPFASFGDRARAYDFRYLQVIAARPERPYTLEIHLRHPAAWEGGISAVADIEVRASPRGGLSSAIGSVVATRKNDLVIVGMSRPRGPLFNGGPFLGFGYALSRDSGPRMRVGYEIAAPYWLLSSIALESDLSRRLTVVPAVEAITLYRSLIPLIYGAGLGLPIGLRPEARLGPRAQVSVSSGFATLRGSLDVLPALAPGLPVHVEGALVLQLSP